MTTVQASEFEDFILGASHPSWLARPALAKYPLCVSAVTLEGRKTLPVALGPTVFDSGGFSRVRKEGGWRMSPEDYVEMVQWFIREICKETGPPLFVGAQDWMCEEAVIYGRRDANPKSQAWFHGTQEARGIRPGGPDEPMEEAVFKHQSMTVANYARLVELDDTIPWLLTLQGDTPESYVRCGEMFKAAGHDPATKKRVGLGSVCRRQRTDEIVKIVRAVRKQGITGLHGFGVKKEGLRQVGHLLRSADSMAWAYRGMKTPTKCGSSTHKNEANCMDFALEWREDVLAALAEGPRKRAPRKRAPRLDQPMLPELEMVA